MKRYIIQSVIKWAASPARQPLILRGARQTGKTFIVERFGKDKFKNIIKINFEIEKKFKLLFLDLGLVQAAGGLSPELVLIQNLHALPAVHSPLITHFAHASIVFSGF